MPIVFVFVCEEVVIVFSSRELVDREFSTLTWVDTGEYGKWVARIEDNLSAYLYMKEVR